MGRSDKSDGNLFTGQMAGVITPVGRDRWFRRQELYPGSIMELENLHGNDGQQRATREWKSGCRRETYNGNTPEAVNRCIMQGQTNS